MLWRSSSSARHPPGFVEPCLPTLGHIVPTGPQWAYEIKHDGFRFICRREGDRVRVFSRRGNDYTDRAPRIAKALAALRVKSVTLDGEGAAAGDARGWVRPRGPSRDYWIVNPLALIIGAHRSVSARIR
jgi:ATP-dependent DNA ligase